MAKRATTPDLRPVQSRLTRDLVEQTTRPVAVIPAPVSKPTAAEIRPQPAPELPPAEPESVHLDTDLQLTQEKRVLISPNDERELERLTADLAKALGVKLKSSHLMRALVIWLLHADDYARHEFQKAKGTIRRPENKDLLAIADFDHRLARLLASALQKAEPLDSGISSVRSNQ